MTMAQLAVLAGVSKITVSRALRCSSLVNPAVRDQIQRIAADHGYRLNTAARDLRLGRRRQVSIAIHLGEDANLTATALAVAGLLQGLLDWSRRTEVQLILTSLADLDGRTSLADDGVIVLGHALDLSTAQALAAVSAPLILWTIPEVGSPASRTPTGRSAGEGLVIAKAARSESDPLFLGPQDDPALAEVRYRLGPSTPVDAYSCEDTADGGAGAFQAARRSGWDGNVVLCASKRIALGATIAVAGDQSCSDVAISIVGCVDDGFTPPCRTDSLHHVEWKRLGASFGARLSQQMDRAGPDR